MIDGSRIEVALGDITRQRVDAVVNAANRALLGGGGVDGAIHRAAGPALLTECERLRRTRHPEGLAVGDAVATGAGDLPCRWVIHTVGPNRRAGEVDPALLASCFESSLREAALLGARSVAFPAVSAGVFGWDPAEVASIAIATVTSSTHRAALDLVRFVLFSEDIHESFVEALGEPTDGAR